ncbi:MAG: DNA-directed RNA polymerase subunit P [Candidatus Micrarchaeia archaeon]
MEYVCLHCGKTITKLEKNAVRCPYCGYRVLAKKRAPIAKEVSTD